MNHFCTISFSVSRERIGVTEIGRQSAKQTGLGSFGTGVMTDRIQCFGTTPAQKEHY